MPGLVLCVLLLLLIREEPYFPRLQVEQFEFSNSKKKKQKLKRGCIFHCRSGPYPERLLQLQLPLLKPRVVSLNTAVLQQHPATSQLR